MNIFLSVVWISLLVIVLTALYKLGMLASEREPLPDADEMDEEEEKSQYIDELEATQKKRNK